MPHEIIMPALGMAQDSALIIAWHKQPGDAVKSDDVLMEVETDKATMEVEAGYDGFVVEIRAGVDVPVPVGDVVAIIAAEPSATTGLDGQNQLTPPPTSSSNASDSRQSRNIKQDMVQQQADNTAPNSRQSAASGKRILASPKAQLEAHRRGIDLAELVAHGIEQPIHMSDLKRTDLYRPQQLVSDTGEHNSASRTASASPKVRKLARENEVDLDRLATTLGRDQIGAYDVVNETDRPPLTTDTAPNIDASQYWDVDHSLHGDAELIALPRTAHIAARNLTAAHQLIPAVTHHDRVAIEEVEKIRADLIDDSNNAKVRLTALSFHAKSLASTLVQFPYFNASLSVDGKGLWLKKYVSIGIAVDTEYGLKVVVVRNCDRKSLMEIAAEIQDMATRAKARKVRPDEMGGAGMSISNLGPQGPEFFSPIINPPEVAILGISRTSVEPVWSQSSFIPRKMTPLSLTYDHRVINGADAVAFLSFYKQLLLKPWRLLA